ncbi:ABC transporter ATP-binding protein [Corynebacterium sp. sy039]|uniref:ATP-binding cassette domain-containing protein n=1 Tax=Corynebacterium sp. sy039 TaxID=2599641 RepID=UPI0011B553E3|nr:ABC transporter ATP-binding protein [Corynebacterium sp. sy039]QDZ43175.1 ABC transporter ATP-binding protein [Corynebacterium sp. sy039]
MNFLVRVITQAWRLSPWRNAVMVLMIILSALCSVIAPYVLGQGVASIVLISDRGEFLRSASIMAIAYSLLWFIGSTLRYMAYPIYGLIEQKLQSDVMARSLSDSITADAHMRHRIDNTEVSFAIDTEAGAYRDTLSGLYLSLLPAFISLTAGIGTVIYASTWVEGLILLAAIVLYGFITRSLIGQHQAAQTEMFQQNMRSFGVLGNSLSLWKEAMVFSVPHFLATRYREDRIPVENAGKNAYAATRKLYVAQNSILALTICALIFTISFRTHSDPATAIGTIVSTVGIAIAAISPLQTVGFGFSSLAVAITHEKESRAKINPTRSDTDLPNEESSQAPWQKHIHELAQLLTSEQAQHSGRPIWVLGASGTGKTTVLEGLLGLNTSQPQTDVVKRGYAQQTPGLLNATAMDNVIFGREIPVETASSALSRLGLEMFALDGSAHGRDVAGEEGGVSGGERQRIAIARALSDAPGTLIVLDEPTSGLDATARALAWDFIEEKAHENTVIIATHDSSAPIRADDKVVRLSAQD